MTTIVNTPPTSEHNNFGLFLAVFALVIVGLVFTYFGIPAMRNQAPTQLRLPAPVINVPEKVDVTVEQK